MRWPWIDARGRLFGRLNVIDGAISVFALILLSFSYRLYRIATFPAPIIESVEPRVVEPGYLGKVRVTGRHFGDRLFIKVARSPLVGVFLGAQRLDERTAEITLLQPLTDGVYTVLAANSMNKLAQLPDAICVKPASEALSNHEHESLQPIEPVSVLNSQSVRVRVKARAFGVIEPVAKLVSQGDSDTYSDADHRMHAHIERVRVSNALHDRLTRDDKDIVIELLADAVETDGMLYYQHRQLRIGDAIAFRTMDYDLPSLIVFSIERLEDG